MNDQIQPVPGLLEIKSYVSGGVTPKKYTRKVGLASNESLLGPSPHVLKKINELSPEIYKYPNASVKPLRDAIAEYHEIESDRILCTAGSEDGLTLLVRAFVGPGDEVVISQYAFQVYDIATKSVGAKTIRAPAPNYVVEVDSLLSKVTNKTKMVMIDNPSNPVGGVLSKDELVRLRKGLPENILLVIDSAYAEFIQNPNYTAGIDLVNQSDNVVMTRTFSKFYALAGLRLGWLYAPLYIQELVNRIRLPFCCNNLVQEAGIIALQDTLHQKKILTHNTKWLNWFTEQIKSLGLRYIPSSTNFLSVEFPASGHYTAENAYDAMATHGYIVRPLKDYNMPNHLRISIGLEEDMKEVVKILETFLKQNSLQYDIN